MTSALMRRRRLVGATLVLGVLAAVLSACSGSHHSAARTSLPSGAASTSGRPGPSTTDPGGDPAGSSSSATGSRSASAPSSGTTTSPVNEGVTIGSGPACLVASPAAVATAFGGHVATTKVSTSGLGNPLCIFTLTSSNIGVGGTITMSLDSKSSPAQFATVQKQVGGQTVAGLGDAAFYVGNTSTMQVRRGNTAAVVQASMSGKSGTKYAAAIERDIVAISRVILAQI